MIIEVNVPDYDKSKDLIFQWDRSYSIGVYLEDELVKIVANKAGLISLARHLLMLANEDVPNHSHMHFDENSCLENDSFDLLIEKDVGI